MNVPLIATNRTLSFVGEKSSVSGRVISVGTKWLPRRRSEPSVGDAGAFREGSHEVVVRRRRPRYRDSSRKTRETDAQQAHEPLALTRQFTRRPACGVSARSCLARRGVVGLQVSHDPVAPAG